MCLPAMTQAGRKHRVNIAPQSFHLENFNLVFIDCRVIKFCKVFIWWVSFSLWKWIVKYHAGIWKQNAFTSLVCLTFAVVYFRKCHIGHSVVIYWRIIACESSDYRHIVHDDGFVWLMFVHERFSASEQTLNSQNHGVHYMSVITRLTCNNSILLTRNSPDWQIYRNDTADNMALCISGIVLGMTGLRLWLACVHKGNISTS